MTWNLEIEEGVRSTTSTARSERAGFPLPAYRAVEVQTPEINKPVVAPGHRQATHKGRVDHKALKRGGEDVRRGFRCEPKLKRR